MRSRKHIVATRRPGCTPFPLSSDRVLPFTNTSPSPLSHPQILAGNQKFFDRVNHDVLMARVAKRVRDKRVLRAIGRYLRAGTMEGGVTTPRREGTPQGGPLAPQTQRVTSSLAKASG